IPRHALAHGLWVGACPELLQDLTYVEQLMIAQFRHSFCVVLTATSKWNRTWRA
ncbi:hypothetical protein OH76DRAFT_1341614, partial [Lentinus brumalis]